MGGSDSLFPLPAALMAGFCSCNLAASERQNTHPGRRRTSTTEGRSAQRVAALTVAAAVPLVGVGRRVRLAPAMSESFVFIFIAAAEAPADDAMSSTVEDEDELR